MRQSDAGLTWTHAAPHRHPAGRRLRRRGGKSDAGADAGPDRHGGPDPLSVAECGGRQRGLRQGHHGTGLRGRRGDPRRHVDRRHGRHPQRGRLMIDEYQLVEDHESRSPAPRRRPNRSSRARRARAARRPGPGRTRGRGSSASPRASRRSSRRSRPCPGSRTSASSRRTASRSTTSRQGRQRDIAEALGFDIEGATDRVHLDLYATRTGRAISRNGSWTQDSGGTQVRGVDVNTSQRTKRVA